MPKLQARKLKTQISSLKDFLDTYDAVTLHSALNTFEGSLGWEVLKAYSRFTQRAYEVAALDKLPKQDETMAAAYAAGYAKACEDLEGFVDGLRKTILGSTMVIEDPRPEE